MSTSSTVVSTLDEEMGLMSEKAPDPPSTFNALFHLGVPSIYRVWLEKSWMPELMEALSSFRGFQHHSVHVLSNEGDYVQYAIILQFDTVQVLNRWQSSEERGKLVKRLEHKKIKIFSVDHYGGLIAANTPNQDEENGGMEAIKTKFHLQDAMQFLPRPQPPPKWKLFIIIYVNVIFCILIEQIGGSTAKMIASGVPIGLAIFFAQFHSVPFMSYVTMPLCLSIPWVSYWLRLPRPRVEDLHPVLAVLEQGLQMFALQPTDVQLQARVRKLEERLDRLRSINNDLNHRVESLSERTTSIPHLQRAKSQAIVRHDAVDKALTARKDSPPSSTKSDGINPSQPLFTSSGPLTMVVRHYIKWEHVLDFNIWCDRIDEEMKKHKGYLGMMRILPACDEDPYINSFTFDTLQNLMDYIKSEGRMELLRELEPMLSATCEADLSQERVINNAFSELFVHTGSAAHMRPPPIWKSVILTIVSLMTIIWLAGNGINVVFAKEGLDAWTSLFLNCVLTVGLNTWIGLPSMQYLFGEWLRLPVPPQGSFGCTACKFLDDGFSLPIQCIVFVIYCALNILSGYLGF